MGTPTSQFLDAQELLANTFAEQVDRLLGVNKWPKEKMEKVAAALKEIRRPEAGAMLQEFWEKHNK
jgi:hypothetical protein